MLLLAAPAPDALGFVEQHLFLCRSESQSWYFPGLAFNCVFLFVFNGVATAGLPVPEVSAFAPLRAVAVRAASLAPLQWRGWGWSLCFLAEVPQGGACQSQSDWGVFGHDVMLVLEQISPGPFCGATTEALEGSERWSLLPRA